MNRAVGVLIIDEPEGLDPSFRDVLEHEPNLHTFGEADLTGEAASEAAVALVFLRDAAPEAGIARIATLKDRRPALRILVAFQTVGADAVRGLAAAGAEAFVARTAPARDICAALQTLARDAVPSAIPDAFDRADLADGLTPREAEILRFLSAGFSNKEVARRLSLSVRTVETHRLNLRRKTQTGRLKDLVSLARQLGLAPVVEAEAPRRSSAEALPHPRPPAIEALARH